MLPRCEPNAVSTVLVAGNHTLLGLYDLPLLVHELYLRGYKVRGLAHPGHWKTPLGPIFESLGAVKASPMAAYRLLQDAEAVLLFPGGGREVSPTHITLVSITGYRGTASAQLQAFCCFLWLLHAERWTTVAPVVVDALM